MAKTLIFSRDARKALEAIPQPSRGMIVSKVCLYAEHPDALNNMVKALAGSRFLRLRVGDYRVIFEESSDKIDVLRIGHRSKVYD